MFLFSQGDAIFLKVDVDFFQETRILRCCSELHGDNIFDISCNEISKVILRKTCIAWIFERSSMRSVLYIKRQMIHEGVDCAGIKSGVKIMLEKASMDSIWRCCL